MFFEAVVVGWICIVFEVVQVIIIEEIEEVAQTIVAKIVVYKITAYLFT